MKDKTETRDEYPAFDYDEEEPYREEGNDAGQEQPESGERRGGLRLLTSIQIFGSLAILIAALALRFSGTDLYRTVRGWYLSAANDSILAEEQIDQAKHTVVGLWDNISAARSSEPPQGSQKAAGSEPAASNPGSAQSAAGRTAS